MCVSSILSPFLSLSHSLSISPKSTCASVTPRGREVGREEGGGGREGIFLFFLPRGRRLTSDALRPLFRHRLPESQVSAVRSAPFGRGERWQGRQPIRLGPLNGEHAHHAVPLVPQREAASLAWMCLGRLSVVDFFLGGG